MVSETSHRKTPMTPTTHRGRLVASLVFTISSLASLTAVSPAAGADPTDTTPDPAACGTSPSSAFTTCAFADDFTGGSLDTARWTVVTTPNTGITLDATTCFAAQQVSVAGGYLQLTSRKYAGLHSCGLSLLNPVGSLTSTAAGGMVTTKDKFSTTYGRIEFRAAFPALPAAPRDVGQHSALWMSPQTPGVWPYEGEIDVAERMPTHGGPVESSLHYADASGAVSYLTGDKNPGDTTDCTPADPTAFHTYSIEWTPTLITFLVDDTTCAAMTWDPTDQAPPGPFDKPFYLSMEQGNAAGSPVGTYTTRIDWVKVWTS